MLAAGLMGVIAALGAAAPAGSSPAAKAKPKPKPKPALTIATPKQGRVSAVVLTFARKEGAKPPTVTLAQRYRGPKTVGVAAGVSQWANSTTKWVALIMVVNFKPQPPQPVGGRALAAAKPPPPLRFRASKPYATVFKGNVRVDRGVRRFVIQNFGWKLAFARKQTGVAPAYARADVLLNEGRFALAGVPHTEFADAVLGRVPVQAP
jgi:hypothetical protein